MREILIDEMKTLFGEDERRISHALKVLDYAERILEGSPCDGEVVTAAAILHDIGIHEAERKHNSAAGQYQELEGPPIARKILRKTGFPAGKIDHVCRIVGSHHSVRDIDTPEFRIVWDADWLVNIPEEFPDHGQARLAQLVERVFKTVSGKELAKRILL